MFERDADTLTSVAYMLPDNESGQSLTLTGVVFETDGETPAEGITLYAYQTDAEGYYSRGTPETEWSRRHGLLRGWAITGADGHYTFHTIRPGPYPGLSAPAHIHLTVLEPGMRPYWIDDVVFEDDPRTNSAYRSSMSNKGGDGIITIERTGNDGWQGKRDIILEVHP